MASIEKRTRDGKTSWRAHYRTPDGKQRNRSFTRKTDAERFLVGVENSKLIGSYIDPRMARLNVADLAPLWVAGQTHLKPSTLHRYEGLLRRHVVPKWGTTRLSDVSHGDVQTWVSELTRSRSPATVRKIHNVLSLVMALAVKDGRLARNPASDINLPRVVTGERRYLTHDEVEQVAANADYYRTVILFLAYTGVRFGEAAALRVTDVDLNRGRAAIHSSLTEVNGTLVWGTPKTYERRDVPVPGFLLDELGPKFQSRAPESLAFPGFTGVPLRVRVLRGPFNRAVASAGLSPMRPHDLRHTAASLAIASGANVKVVQQMLGHKSAIMTLDLYGHLFPDQLHDVADRMDQAHRSAVARLLPHDAPIES